MQWAREHSGGTLLRVVAETTSPESDALLRRARACGAPSPSTSCATRSTRSRGSSGPRACTSPPVDDDTAGAVPHRLPPSFADRPGFPDPPRDVWVARWRRTHGFRPELSRVALDPDGQPPASSRSPTTGSTRSGSCPPGAAAASGPTSSCARCARCARRLRPGLARRQRRQPGPRALPPAGLRGPRPPGALRARPTADSGGRRERRANGIRRRRYPWRVVQPTPGALPWPCACRPCSCEPFARTRRTPRSRATSCSCGPATSVGSARASTPGCRSA